MFLYKYLFEQKIALTINLDSAIFSFDVNLSDTSKRKREVGGSGIRTIRTPRTSRTVRFYESV